jgi:hypothetical protein
MSSKPEPMSLKHVKTELTQRKVAIYADIILEDDVGRKLKMKVSSFYFDLKPIDEP